ncbi:hypothetical protein L228DRAFT_147137 [Xylona heveae TC161]|uniref:Uncharacterized protein n=1 Tax=Xylona heveae (strain CBS 132557 / TC161) TaxID=1328760 RepID=A0A165GG61_XYLHT|nr:hypothetical protein L228DRAFT_147137 [Xylona heveae TC161]KZF22141.1 hypothetical protein L228DRAFT_147137 [Xylona heveae TC161]
MAASQCRCNLVAADLEGYFPLPQGAPPLGDARWSLSRWAEALKAAITLMKMKEEDEKLEAARALMDISQETAEPRMQTDAALVANENGNASNCLNAKCHRWDAVIEHRKAFEGGPHRGMHLLQQHAYSCPNHPRNILDETEDEEEDSDSEVERELREEEEMLLARPVRKSIGNQNPYALSGPLPRPIRPPNLMDIHMPPAQKTSSSRTILNQNGGSDNEINNILPSSGPSVNMEDQPSITANGNPPAPKKDKPSTTSQREGNSIAGTPPVPSFTETPVNGNSSSPFFSSSSSSYAKPKGQLQTATRNKGKARADSRPTMHTMVIYYPSLPK